MKTLANGAYFVAALVFQLFATAEVKPGNESISSAMQPFVDRHELAGAVMLVAAPQEILSHTAVGFANNMNSPGL